MIKSVVYCDFCEKPLPEDDGQVAVAGALPWAASIISQLK